MLGLKELALIAAVVFVLYGRSGVFKDPRFQRIQPYLSPVRRGPSRPPTRKTWLTGSRIYWFLTILAATAIAAWIIGRALILRGPS